MIFRAPPPVLLPPSSCAPADALVHTGDGASTPAHAAVLAACATAPLRRLLAEAHAAAAGEEAVGISLPGHTKEQLDR